ncbi:hypothetical protein [Aquicoccus sp.]|uniref:hypothetical protein n=1 Tax=Aquicoccus sp. TaxID=2055851 RepID=UPI003562799A
MDMQSPQPWLSVLFLRLDAIVEMGRWIERRASLRRRFRCRGLRNHPGTEAARHGASPGTRPRSASETAGHPGVPHSATCTGRPGTSQASDHRIARTASTCASTCAEVARHGTGACCAASSSHHTHQKDAHQETIVLRILSALRTGPRLRTEACTGARHLCPRETTRAAALGELITGLAAEALSGTCTTDPHAKSPTQPTSTLATKAPGAPSGKSSFSATTEALRHIAMVHTIIFKTRF